MNINTYLNQPFTLFNSNKNKWTYVLSSTVFALFFLLLFQPYGLSEEITNPINSSLSISIFFLSVSVISFLGLSTSQFLIRNWLNFKTVSVKKYAKWFFIEALIITLLNFVFSFFIPDLGNDFEKELNLIFQIKIYFKVVFVLLFPFLGCVLYFLVKDLNYEIKELETQLKSFKMQFTPLQREVPLVFKDENNNTDFSIDLEDFLFAESSNQYILVYYLKEGLVKKHIVRNRMKNFLSQIENLPIIQCHRSYSVNLLNVKHKTKKGGKQSLAINTTEPLFVPISKSYLSVINQKLA